MKVSNKDQCIEELKKFGKELNEVTAKNEITQKIEQFLDENGEFFKENADVAAQLDSVGVKVKANLPDSPLVNKIRGCVQGILPGDAAHRSQSLKLLRAEGAEAKSISDWMDLLDIPVDELDLSDDELMELFQLKFQVKEIPYEQNPAFLQKVSESTEQEKKILIELVKRFARGDGNKIAGRIQHLGIQDQATLIEIAKLCAQQNGGGTAIWIQNFGIQDQVVLIEIAKLCAQQDGGETAKCIRNFGIQDQAALIEIAKLCAQQDGSGTAQYIQNFGIQDQADLIEIARLCVKQSGKVTAQYIQNFGIQDQATLIEIAKLCAQQNGGGTALCIRNFGIKDQAALIEIAKLCAQQSGGGTALCIRNFGIQDQVALIEIAKLCAQQNDGGTARNIQDFGIQDQAALIEIAKLCAQQNGGGTALYIKNFGIQDQSALIEIARLCAKQSGGRTAKYIQNFGIQDLATLIEIAKLCAQQDGRGIVLYIQNFGIQDQATLIEIAKLCAQESGWGTALYIQNFGIQDQATLIEIAKLCAQRDGGRTALTIRNFGIKDQATWIEIAKLCAQQNGGGTAKYIQNIGIEDSQVRLDILLECLHQDEAALEYVSNFMPLPERFQKLCERIDVLKSDDLESEKREQLFTALKEFIDGLTLSEENKSQIHPIANEIYELTPYQQRPQALMLLGALNMLSQMDREAADWVVERGLLKDLRALRNPSLKNQLTSGLLTLAQDTEGRKAWEMRLQSFSLVKGMQLVALPLQGLINQGVDSKLIDRVMQSLSRTKVADDAMKIQRLLQVLQLIYSSELLTPDMKSSAVVRIFPENVTLNELEEQKRKANPRDGKLIRELTQKIGRAKADDERQLLKNITAAKGLMQLQETAWIDSEEDLNKLFVDCFTKLVPLEGFEGDAAESYEKIFASCRNPTGLITYAAGLKTLNDSEVLPSLGRFVVSVFNGNFRGMRYDPTSNPHLTKIYEARPDLREKWKECPKIEAERVSNESTQEAQMFNSTAWLRTKLLDDRHLGSEDVSFVQRYLEANDKMAKEQIQREIAEAAEKAQEDQNLKIQRACIQLAALGNEKPLSALEEPFRDIKDALKGGNEFVNDVDGILKAVKQAEAKASAQQEFFVKITDDPIDLMLAGTDVSGSCQRLNGTPGLNKGLLGYMMDGKNQLIAIKDKSGKIVARTMLRLLWDGKKPVLFRERFYPDPIDQNAVDAMNKMALELGKELGLSVTTGDDTGAVYGEPLQALGGPAPWEYSDGSGGVQKNGVYTIEEAYLLGQEGQA